MNSKVWSYVKDGLVILVVPLILWGIRLEVTLAVQQEKLNAAMADLQEAQGSNKDISALVGSNSNQLTALYGKIDVANARLEGIKELLDK